ncbi:MAG: DUF1700 domain-containing protein [Telluria sp.]
MGKQEYLDALTRALDGLPPETVARTLAYYEQRYVDGMAAGQTEEEVGRDLDDPRKIAMTLRTSAHFEALSKRKQPVNLVRTAFTAVALGVFNLFMLVPALVALCLLVALYATSLGTYVSGIAITASGLAGANELVLAGPLKKVHINGMEVDSGQTRVSIGKGGIEVFEDDATPDAQSGEDMIQHAEQVAQRGIRIYTDMDAKSRTTQTLAGLGLVIMGVAFFLLSIVVTRVLTVAARRYADMNISLLKGS